MQCETWASRTADVGIYFVAFQDDQTSARDYLTVAFLDEPPADRWPEDDGLLPPTGVGVQVANARQYRGFSDYIKSFEPPDYLLEGILQTNRVYSLTAMTGHLKTAWATYMALSVACGAPVSGRETKKCPVLFLSGENDEDQKGRTIATADEFKLYPDDNYFRVLSGSEAIGILRDEIPRETKKLGNFGLVVADTSIAYFGGEDENDNVQLRAHASMFRELCANLGGASAVILCHPTKAPGKDNLIPRGGGAFLNEVDGNLTLWRQDDKVTLHHQGKFRGPSFEPIDYLRKMVTLKGYKDAKGRPIDSVVITPMTEIDSIRADVSAMQDAHQVLYLLLRHHDQSLSDHARHLGWLDANGNPIKSKVHRILSELAADGLAKMELKKWKLTPAGEKLAKTLRDDE